MARFEPGTQVVSREPTIIVDRGLPPGEYLFQLEVVDETGERSTPALARVFIVESGETFSDKPRIA